MNIFNIEIQINGTVADFKDDDITLTFEASKVGEASFHKGFSQMLQLPKTANNNFIFGGANDLHAYQKQIYQPFEVKLFINKVPVIANAKGYLQEVTDTDFLFFIIENNTDVFDPYKGKKVSDFFKNYITKKDLQLDINQDLNFNIIYPLADFKGNTAPKYNTNHSIGAINFIHLINVLQQSNPNPFNSSLFDKKNDFIKNVFVSLSQVGHSVVFKKQEEGSFFAQGDFFTIRDTFREQEVELSFFVETQSTYIVQNSGMYVLNGVLKTDKIQAYYTDLGPIYLVVLVNDNIAGKFKLNHKQETKINHQIVLEQGQRLKFAFESYFIDNLYVTNVRPYRWEDILNKRKTLLREFALLEDLFEQGNFLELQSQSHEQIALTMIQADSYDFFKELCQIFALTPIKLKDGTLHLKTINERLNAPIIDWSDKFIRLKKIRFADNSVAKNNIFQFKTDDNQNPRPSVFTFENEHLQKEKSFESKIFYQDHGTTLLKMDNGQKEKVGVFAYFQNQYDTKADKGVLHEIITYKPTSQRHYFMQVRQGNSPKTLYKITDDKTQRELKTFEQTLPLLASPFPIEQITRTYAKDLRRLYEQPKIISCQCYLLLSDIVNFSFFSRIYIKALQGEFIPLKIRYSRYQSQVELLYIPPEYSPIP